LNDINPDPEKLRTMSGARAFAVLASLASQEGIDIREMLRGVSAPCRTACAACGKQIPPGRAGRRCEECRESVR